MVRIEIDTQEFNVVLAGLIRMAQAAKVARDRLMELGATAPNGPDEELMNAAVKKQAIIDQAFATLSSVGKSARESSITLTPDTRSATLKWVDSPEVLDALKWAAEMWSDVVGEHPILNADGTVFQRPERSE